MIVKMSVLFGIIFMLLVQSSIAERTRDKMYQAITGASCFRRLNATHQTGCSSPFSGSVGVLHLISTAVDIDFLVNKPPAPPYAPVIPPHLFTRDNILRIKNDAAKYVSAIILINKIDKLIDFSHELKCPNPFSGLISEQTCDPSKQETTWNPYGTGLLHEDFPFPIYYVADNKEIQKIIDCFEKFNNFDVKNQKHRSLCSIQVNSFMSAAVNSEVCIRRTGVFNNLTPTKFCDPLQGRNIYTTLFPRPIVDPVNRVVDESEKIILVSARLDTTSFFDGIGLGAMDSLVSFATLISVAHLLATLIPDRNAGQKNVLFMLFNGESYDYIGSQRFVYDLQKKDFPTKSTSTNILTLENIEFMIDIGPLDDLNNLKIYYAKEFPYEKSFKSAIDEYNAKFTLGLNITEQQSLNLPPTSAQSFLRENISFPVVIVTSNSPKNKFYHSIYDDGTNIGFKYQNTSQDFTKLDTFGAESPFEANSTQIKIRNTATGLAFALYYLVTREVYQKDQIASSVLIDEFLYCFLESADCPLFKAASPPNSLPGLSGPPLRYISVAGGSQEAAGWTLRLLGYLVGSKVQNAVKKNCTEPPLHWIAGFNGTGECRLTKSNYSSAYSPAFSIEGYDWQSGKYSTWTESTWFPMSARIFLQPSKTHEAVTLAIGLVVMIISFIVVFLINSRSDVLFGTCPSSSPITTPAAC
ncbi:nicastrin [Hermetia illucens]|uniref:nicastrin n=1 Tax=Hermetia illucens TaxID=343691 RepID=UPI0018CC4E04|nr:nicastrin [Hermetia illucens]XP_037912163.1 nicastrin [Hermetia illucens]